MGHRTPLYSEHVRHGAKIVDFAGWDMPLNYGSQIEEHRQVRSDAGMFDVSHMTVSDVSGAGAIDYLRHMFANDVVRLDAGKALYTCMLNEGGGVIDDLIVYRLNDQHFRLITNAATRDKDLAWLRQHAAAFGAALEERTDGALIAVQGPRARDKVHAVLKDDAARAAVAALGTFRSVQVGQMFISRTGYTGEDGYEILLPAGHAPAFWQALHEAGVKPIGLGARDTLRLEAGMALYGSDMDETVTPLESGLAWTVAWNPPERAFIGRARIEADRARPARKSIGLVLREGGVLRAHQQVYVGDRLVGEITSGSFSPFLQCSIALARVSSEVANDCAVDVRGRRLAAQVVTPPFVRHGKSCIAPA
ncbi:MAG: glycine cleavage system aminomethyltransferase GcvT [Gammaproteobacteria bacterium]